jgi:non-ribosomal peptide synthetase component F
MNEFDRNEIERSIPDRFDRQAAKYADRIAIKTRNRALTYDALNKMANRVAWAAVGLQGDGNEPIAMLMESDAPMMAATFGLLKAGKICVPLDPSHPKSRITHILKDSQARLILTNKKNLVLANELTHEGFEVIDIDQLDPTLPDHNLGRSYVADTLAFILYTSGSTGEPKGVVQNHRNLLHLVMKWTNDFGICADDRLSFVGAARRDIFRVLLNGGSVYSLDLKEEGLAGMGHWLRENGITILHSVPTPFRHFVDTLGAKEEFPALRMIVLNGEPLYARDVELYKRHFSPTCILVNSLGSTEAYSYSYYAISKQTQITESIVPVGRAFNDIEVLLFNEAGEQIGCSRLPARCRRRKQASLFHRRLGSDAVGRSSDLCWTQRLSGENQRPKS